MKLLRLFLFLSVFTKSTGLLSPATSWKQSIVHHHCHVTTHTTSIMAGTRDDNNAESVPNTSRLQGNNRKPTQEELAVMDEMITKLANAKPYELPNAVRRAIRVISSPPFFLRIAERVDMAQSDAVEQEKLSALASNLVNTLEAIVSTAEDRLEERAKEVQDVLKAAAEPDSGEFFFPLLPERVVAMRAKLEGLDPSSLDEGFLSTLDAWINKSYQDGMHLMVGILQKVLQAYAGTQISRELKLNNPDAPLGTSAVAALMDQLLQIDTDVWDVEIRKNLSDDATAAALTLRALKNEVQRTMETVVLGLDTGSMAQRVQAEYLRELVLRIEDIESKI